MGLVSPMAWVQCRIMGRFTGSGATRGGLSPAAAIRSAACLIAAVVSSVAITPSRSPGDPGQPESRRRDQFALDFVDSAAERQHGVSFGLNIKPVTELGSFLLSRVAVPRHHLLQQLAQLLQGDGGVDLG